MEATHTHVRTRLRARRTHAHMHPHRHTIPAIHQYKWAIGDAKPLAYHTRVRADVCMPARRHSLTHSLTHSRTHHSLITHARTHSRTHARTHSLTHALTHAPTHARTHARMHALAKARSVSPGLKKSSEMLWNSYMLNMSMAWKENCAQYLCKYRVNHVQAS